MNKLLKSLLLAALLAAGTAYWFGRQTPDASAQPAITVRPSTLIAPGRVEPVRDPVRLSFEAQGRIVAIEVDEGNAVKAGQVIARLDDRLPVARVTAAEAQLAQARARHAMARRGPRAEDLAAARADAEAASAVAAHRNAEQLRSAALGKTGALSTSVVDADEAAARVAASSASAAKACYRSLAKGTRNEQIEEAAAAVQLAQAELDAANVALDQTLLRAPSDGVILCRMAEVGAIVTTMAPMPVVSMADLRRLEIRAEIDEADLGVVAIGQAAFATADAFGDRTFPVRIVRISHELGRKTVRDDDPRARVDTRVLEVIAQFDGVPGSEIPLGLRMSVHVAN